ncbi:MAG TPA: T9SS type A sorting domain-containing protein, partial [Flavobacterium sp.]|nr:T9SS type A sorting domain-containing protein [Flavobacterium sp.]
NNDKCLSCGRHFFWHKISTAAKLVFIPLLLPKFYVMKKHYFYIFLLFLCCSLGAEAQEPKSPGAQETIEGLNFYPNPVSSGKIYISSRSALAKEVAIYDVLGKKVLAATVSSSKELSVASLSPGVYIIKIKEGEAAATRKLIVK